MSTRQILWAAFLLVHLGVAVIGWIAPGSAMGDVYLVYEPWSTKATNGEGIMGVTEPFVYPQLALVPMLLAKAFAWAGGYIIAWSIVVTALDAIAFAVLLGHGRRTFASQGRTYAAWFWLAGIAALGPVGMYRIDAIVVPIAILGLLWLAGRPVVAAALLAVGTWIKIWPAALLATAFIVMRRRWSIAAVSVGISAIVAAGVLALGGAAHLLSFVSGQTGRGLQLEAPVSTPYLWCTMFQQPGCSVYYDTGILTYQVTGPAIDTVIALMTPLLVLAVAAIVLLGAYKSRAGASFVRLFPPLSLALVLVLIVFNKVGSPQFMTWLIPPIVFWIVLDRVRATVPAGLALALLGMTQLVYPFWYNFVLAASAPGVVLLTIRNIVEIVLLVIVVIRVVQVPTKARVGLRETDVVDADAASFSKGL